MRKPTAEEAKDYFTECVSLGYYGCLHRVVDLPIVRDGFDQISIPIELTDNPVYPYEAIAPDGFIFSANDARTILGRSLKELSVLVLEGIETEEAE